MGKHDILNDRTSTDSRNDSYDAKSAEREPKTRGEPEDTKRVAAIRSAVGSGEYRIQTKALAAAIMSRMNATKNDA